MKNTVAASLLAGFMLSGSVGSLAVGAHQHGVAVLMVGQQGAEVELVFESPADNLVGFEHRAQTAAEQQKLAEAESIMSNPEQLFVLPAAAKCRLRELEQDWPAVEAEGHDEHHDHDEHDHHAKHDDHNDHDKHDGHDHHAKHDDHSDHDKHDDHHKHHDHDEESGHSDVAIQLHFDCDNADALTEVKVELFKFFPALERIEVQSITDRGQNQAQLKSSQNTFIF
jgi:hypothetical protein